MNQEKIKKYLENYKDKVLGYNDTEQAYIVGVIQGVEMGKHADKAS